MGTTAFEKDQRLMPGTFGPEDYVDFYENPFQTLDEIQTAWRARTPDVPWSTNNFAADIADDVNWHDYAPPKSVKKAPYITSQVLLDIISSSIDNVKARAVSEDQQRREEKQRRDEESAEAEKSKDPYLPIIIPEDRPQPEPSTETKDDAKSQISESASFVTVTRAEPLNKTEKRHRFALRRLFQRSAERGESSATGSTLESLRRAYDVRKGGFKDADTENPLLMNKLTSLKTPAAPSEPVECVSCLDDFDPSEVVNVPCHSYCHECFVRLISAAVQNEQQWPPKCCLNKIPIRTVLRYVPADMKTTVQDRSQEWETPVSKRIYCNQTDCGLFIRPHRVDHRLREARCDQNHVTCSLCHGAPHGNEECASDADLNLTNQLAEEEGWKRCFNCNALVEHKEACQHMTCRCGSQFCYVCGRKWRTCTCTMQQLYDLKHQVESRRDQRRLREEAEAEELRQILLQIEEFEREEALKAELLRQEQERLEEERRQREIEERARQESLRRRDVEIKYQELRVLLGELHEFQLVMLDADQGEEIKDLVIEADTAKEDQANKFESERADLNTLHMAKKSDKEFELLKDFQTRAAAEHEIEEAYHQQLCDYWQGKKDGEEEIETAMITLRKLMDQRENLWQEWKTNQLRLFEGKLEDERSYREELMYSATHRLKDLYDEKETEATKRMAAEKKWFELVILERERLLGEWEVSEVEGDADSLFAEGE